METHNWEQLTSKLRAEKGLRPDLDFAMSIPKGLDLMDKNKARKETGRKREKRGPGKRTFVFPSPLALSQTL